MIAPVPHTSGAATGDRTTEQVVGTSESTTALNTALCSATLDLPQAVDQVWDAVVIGAGPSGAIAARQLALAGWRTLLVDKAAFPRRKVCGGCLNGQSVAMLCHLGLGRVVDEPNALPIDRFQLAYRGAHVEWPLPGGAAVGRADFDAALVRAAVSAGASFLPSVRAAVGERSLSLLFREVVLHPDRAPAAAARGRVVLVAGGLNQTSVRGHNELRATFAQGSRVGLGACIPASACNLEPRTLRMVMHPKGYVGMVHVPGEYVNVAAAVDPIVLREAHAGDAVARLLSGDAPLSLKRALLDADWRGTGPLTRSCPAVAHDDVLLLGDAAGYVEPFTGEGMEWAIHMAIAAAEAVSRSLQRRLPLETVSDRQRAHRIESAALAAEWIANHRAIVGMAQRRCRWIAWLLRHPAVMRGGLSALRLVPGMAAPLIQSVFAPKNRRAGTPAEYNDCSYNSSGLRRLRPKQRR